MLERGESEKSRHISLGPSTSSRFAARWHMRVHYRDLMSDAIGDIRNRYDFSFPVMNQNFERHFAPTMGIITSSSQFLAS